MSWLAAMLGVVNLDKPVGPTSHDMVDLVRRLTAMRRIGHAGTLDPLASGVLPILIGAATRFSDDLTGGPKRYEAVIRLGIRSVTDDAQGPLEPVGPPPDLATVTAALASFVGTFEQRPPAFSARKTGGVIAHRAARAGNPVEAPPRTVTVESIDMLGSEQGDGWLDLRCDIRCGAGTYIRSIARDLGNRLGCGGHLHALRRTEAAGLLIADAIAPVLLEELAAAGRLTTAILPVSSLLHLPEVRLEAEAAGRFVHGSAVQVPEATGTGRHAVFGDGELLG
ncbi:MAG TPA: tRNA pseudouridine(55) synthase TruB, partial [Candidatus Limnocylindria bacterium]